MPARTNIRLKEPFVSKVKPVPDTSGVMTPTKKSYEFTEASYEFYRQRYKLPPFLAKSVERLSKSKSRVQDSSEYCEQDGQTSKVQYRHRDCVVLGKYGELEPAISRKSSPSIRSKLSERSLSFSKVTFDR